jgi:hypothetical protein
MQGSNGPCLNAEDAGWVKEEFDGASSATGTGIRADETEAGCVVLASNTAGAETNTAEAGWVTAGSERS